METPEKYQVYQVVCAFTLQCVPEKTEPWNKGMLWPSSGVYDC